MALSCGPAADGEAEPEPVAEEVAAGDGELTAADAGELAAAGAGDGGGLVTSGATRPVSRCDQPCTPKSRPAIPAIESTVNPRGPTCSLRPGLSWCGRPHRLGRTWFRVPGRRDGHAGRAGR